MKRARDFSLKAGRLLMVRLGPVNAQKQTHRETHLPPVSRGMWAFPYPFHDAFFYFHRWEKRLTKRLSSAAIATETDQVIADALWKERDAALAKCRKEFRPSKFWHGGPFYSHLSRDGSCDLAAWFLWSSAKDWVSVASKQLFSWQRDGDNLFQVPYSVDHLEIFVPELAGNLPFFVAPRRKLPIPALDKTA